MPSCVRTSIDMRPLSSLRSGQCAPASRASVLSASATMRSISSAQLGRSSIDAGHRAARQIAVHRVAVRHRGLREDRRVRGHQHLRAREASRGAASRGADANSSRSDAPETLRNASALRSASSSDATPCADSSCSTSSLRTTRCGRPSICLVTSTSSIARGEVALGRLLRHGALGGQQEARSHRDARGAERERRDEPAAVAEAAGRDDRHAHQRRRTARRAAWSAPCRCGRRPRAPCTMITSAPSFSAFCACFAAPQVGMHSDAGFLQALDHRGARRAVVAGGAHAVRG